MEEQLTKEEMSARLNEIKSVEVDCYGLSKTDRNSNESISQITEFDSFIFQDAIQLALLSPEQITQFKLETEKAAKFNNETKLFSVTIGDLGTSYYHNATMFNRLTNPVYAAKVSRSKELIRQFARVINSQLTNEVKSAIGTQEMTAALRRDDERSR